MTASSCDRRQEQALAKRAAHVATSGRLQEQGGSSQAQRAHPARSSLTLWAVTTAPATPLSRRRSSSRLR